jgi:hypothetical protein
MNPDPTKNPHVKPAMNRFKLLPYTILLTIILLGMSILLYTNNTKPTIYIDPVPIDSSIQRLA